MLETIKKFSFSILKDTYDDFVILDENNKELYKKGEYYFNKIIIDDSFNIICIDIREQITNDLISANEIIKIAQECNLTLKLKTLPGYYDINSLSLLSEYKDQKNILFKVNTEEKTDISFLSEKVNLTLSFDDEKKINTNNILLPKKIYSLSLHVDRRTDNKESPVNHSLKNLKELSIYDFFAFIHLDQSLIEDILNIKSLNSITLPIRNNLTNLNITIENENLEKFHIFPAYRGRLNKNKINLEIYSENLKQLNLSSVNIKNIDDILKNKNLNILDLENCNLHQEDVSQLFKLEKLESLSIINQKIKIDLESDCNNLSVLKLINTGIEDIDFIEQIKNLEFLTSDQNKLDKFPEKWNFNINRVTISKSNIVNIPKEIATHYSINIADKFSRFEYLGIETLNQENRSPELIISQNPIENPPLEIIKQGSNAITEYYDSMEGETSTLNEAKIIFVGDGAVGKTSLMKRLVDNSFSSCEEQTDGIEISCLNIKAPNGDIIKASIWDFGGQQILQATHQLFLSKRSIYVLVVEDRKNDQHKDQDIDKWLTQINSLGGKPPILVVKNKTDENPHSDIQTQKLKTKFKNIENFHEISCKTEDGLKGLKEELSHLVINLSMRRIELPTNWLMVKNELKKQADKEDLLYLHDYKKICTKHDIKSRLAKDTLLHLLHDLGSVIAFKELSSHNTAILNPHWITEGIYALIRSDSLAKNNGIITTKQAQEALDNYTEHQRFDDKAQYIIDAMKTFDLCHMTSTQDEFLIPSLLPPQIDLSDFDFFDNEHQSINFIFKFDNLLPPALIPMFLVKIHDSISGNRRWRTGAILRPSYCDALAKIDSDSVSKEIQIKAIGKNKRDLFITIRSIIKELIYRLADPKEIGMNELIQLDDTDERVSYDELLGLQNMGIHEYHCGKIGQTYLVTDLLGEIEQKEDTDRALKILMKQGTGLINLTMNNDITNTANGGTATNTVTTTQTATATATATIKAELRAFKGQSEFVIDDIVDDINDLTSSDRVLKEHALKECQKVSNAIDELDKNVSDQESAEKNLKHFARVENFLTNVLAKTNNVGKVIDKAGDIYSQVESLASKYNNIASKLAMPLAVLTGIGS